MAKGMATGGFNDSGQPYCLLHGPLQTRFAGMVAAHFARPWVLAQNFNLGLGITPKPEAVAAFVFSIFNLVSTEVFGRQSTKQVYSFSVRL